MTDAWQTILEQQQIIPVEQVISTESTFTPLPQLGLLTVIGDDAQSFLQNLLTNDVAALANNQSQLTGFCNPKGRLFALFILIRRQDCYQLILPNSMCQLLQPRLSMYVLRSKVAITNETDNVALLSINSSDVSHTAALGLTEADYQLLPNNQCLCIIPTDKVEHALTQLEALNFSLSTEKNWNTSTIDAGLPMVFPETKEKFTPQQINLDLVNGVSFKKGCYPGQEVVARLHYLGKPSRRMFKAEVASSNSPAVGSEIINESGDTAGHVVCAELVEPTLVRVLISLKLSALDGALNTANSEPLKLMDNAIPLD